MVFTGILVIISTILQLILCRGIHWFVLCFFVALIGRGLFLLRDVCVVISTKVTIIMEGVAFGIMILSNLLSRGRTDYIGILLYFLLSAVVIISAILDDILFLYPSKKETESHD